jgi:hypothetical protein
MKGAAAMLIENLLASARESSRKPNAVLGHCRGIDQSCCFHHRKPCYLETRSHYFNVPHSRSIGKLEPGLYWGNLRLVAGLEPEEEKALRRDHYSERAAIRWLALPPWLLLLRCCCCCCRRRRRKLLGVCVRRRRQRSLCAAPCLYPEPYPSHLRLICAWLLYLSLAATAPCLCPEPLSAFTQQEPLCEV